MKNFKQNSKKKQSFLSSRPQSSIETSNIEARCKFNFSYFDESQVAGQNIIDWAKGDGICSLENLFKKLVEFTKEPLDYWKNERAGGGGLKIMEVYGKFPSKSDFYHPPHVPHDVSWARFRLGNKVRLIGFVLPKSLKTNDEKNFDKNTFYVVFLDGEHKFYKTESK